MPSPAWGCQTARRIPPSGGLARLSAMRAAFLHGHAHVRLGPGANQGIWAIVALPAQHQEAHRPARLLRQVDDQPVAADLGRHGAVRFGAPNVLVP